MAYLALYRKYRPNSFEEMVGQDKVITVIKNAVKNDKVSHAYLFSGPRGTGKTTTAKIIAKMVNCNNLIDGVPCGKCDNCINIANSSDVIEIDAASNNGVDEIREIRDKVNLVPSELKYKIYIIDEVHMLTSQAFNALLKTLEEPPKHVIFILATTEFYKIPMTIVSRCQKFQFSKIDDKSMVSNLRRIANSEKIDVDDGILYEIAKLSDGCCRDAVNLFDQLISYSSGKITIEQLFELSGSVSFRELSFLLNLIIDKNSVEIMKYCNKINAEGKSIFKFVEEFMLFIKDIISFKFGINDIKIDDKVKFVSELSSNLSTNMLYELIECLNDLLNKLKVSSYPSILLSVSLLKFIDNLQVSSNFKVFEEKDLINKNNDNSDLSISDKLFVDDNIISKVNLNSLLSSDDINIRINNTFALASKDMLNEFKDKWSNIDSYLLDSNFSSLNGILKDCVPTVAGHDYLIVSAKYDSLVDRFNSSYVMIEDFLEKIFGYHIYVVAISFDTWLNEKKKYIKNIKNGIKYEVIKLDVNKNTNISEDKLDTKKNNQSDLDVLKDLVGNDIIKYVD